MFDRRNQHRAFTFPELILGMAVTTMVTMAMSAFAFAMSHAWRQSETTQYLEFASNQTVAYTQQLLRTARYLGECQEGVVDDASDDADDDSYAQGSQAALVYWRADENNDKQMQLYELSMIENIDGKLLYYEAQPLGGLAAQVLTDALSTVTIADLNSVDAVQDLKAWLIFSSPKTLTSDMTEAAFSVDRGSATRRPSVTMTMKFRRDGRTVIRTATATLRSPLTPES